MWKVQAEIQAQQTQTAGLLYALQVSRTTSSSTIDSGPDSTYNITPFDLTLDYAFAFSLTAYAEP